MTDRKKTIAHDSSIRWMHVESGDGFEVVSDDGIDTHFIRYQIKHGYADCDAESKELQVIVGRSLDDSLGAIDVRDLKPQRRHEALFEIFDEPRAGEGFVLVNDHDPKPLYHQFETEAEPEPRWSLLPA